MTTLTEPRGFETRLLTPDAAESTSPPDVWRVGMWSAFVLFALYLAYGAAVVASGIPPRDPAWAVAEVVTLIGVPVQIALFAAIYGTAQPRARIWALLAFGLILAWAALTGAVHFTELLMVRRLDSATAAALGPVFDLAHPSLLLGAELLAWHFFFGFAMLAAARCFPGGGTEALVRRALVAGGLLCLAGLSGPILGNPYLRSIGLLGYGIVFPIACVLIGLRFRAAARQSAPPAGA